MKQNLVDEYHLQLCPAVIGGGRQLFPPDHYFNLQLTGLKKYDSVLVFLQYQPTRV
jgi:dihydrofolate reductase